MYSLPPLDATKRHNSEVTNKEISIVVDKAMAVGLAFWWFKRSDLPPSSGSI